MADQPDYEYEVFLSFAGADRPWAAGYLLPALGLPSDRVITTQSFKPGASLIDEFDRAIRGSRYTVLVLTPAYLTDQWSQFSEELASFASVAGQQDRLIPLLKESVELPLHIDFRVRLDCTDQANWDSAVGSLRTLLNQPKPEPERIPCPYPGMAPFRVQDARFFYGREAEVEQMLRHLRLQRYLFVIGPSGSGKSSLVFGGLLSKLLPGPQRSALFDEGFWLVRDMRPAGQPVQRLAQVLEGDPTQPARAVADLLSANPPAQRLLLVVDQFEELFTQALRADRNNFIVTLKSLRSVGNCALLLTMRADFYPELMSSELWPVDAVQRLEVAPLRGETLRRAIQQPAQDRSVYLETGLADRLLMDAAEEPGVLPLLQETMVLLWSHMSRRLLTLDSYQQLGQDGRSGLAVAIANRADAALADLTTDAQRAIARRIFLRLVQFGEGRPDTRRQQTLDRLRVAGDDQHTFDQVWQHLVDRRLLTLSGEEAEQERRVDIAHEALITGWPMLGKWIAERRKAELTRRHLEDQTAEWQRRERTGGLLDAVELVEVEQWLASPDAADLGGGDPELLALVKGSKERLAQEAQRQHDLEVARTAVELQRAGDAIIRQFEAGGEEIEALLAAVNAAQRLQNLFAGVGFADEYPTISPIAALYSILTSIREKNIFARVASEILGAAISPDGKTIAVVEGPLYVGIAGRNTVQIRGVTGEVLGRWDLAIENFSNVGFSPDSRHLLLVARSSGRKTDQFKIQVRDLNGNLVSQELEAMNLVVRPDVQYLGYIGVDKVAHLCDAAGHVLATLGSAAAPIARLDFSPDGSRIITAGDDGCIRIWRADGQQELEIKGPETGLAYTGFSGSGDWLFGISPDGIVYVWDLAGKLLKQWSSDLRQDIIGSRSAPVLAGLDDQRGIQIWNLEGEQQAQFTAHKGRIVDVQFTPEGRRVMTTGVDGVVQFRDLHGELMFEIRGHAGRIRTLQTSQDGQRAVTLDMENTMRLWDVSERKGPQIDSQQVRVLDIIATHEGFMTAGADGTVRHWQFSGEQIAQWNIRQGSSTRLAMAKLSGDGQQLAASSNDARKLSIWRLSDRQAQEQGYFDTFDAINAAFSPDGRYVIAVEAGGRVNLFDQSGGQPIGFQGFRGWIYSARFDRTGQRVVTVGADHSVRIWDLTGKILSQFDSRHGQVLDADFSPDNQALAIACADGTVVLCDTAGKVLAQCFGHSGRVLTVQYRPDGHRLASVAVDGTVRLWDLAGRQLASFPSNLSPLSLEASGGDFGSPGLAFRADGDYLAVPGAGGIVQLHEIGDLDSLLERAQLWLKDYCAAHA